MQIAELVVLLQVGFGKVTKDDLLKVDRKQSGVFRCQLAIKGPQVRISLRHFKDHAQWHLPSTILCLGSPSAVQSDVTPFRLIHQ